MHFLLIIGIALCIFALILLTLFAVQSLKLKTMDIHQRSAMTNKLIALNFGAIALATLGLILVFFSLKFN